MLTHFSFPRRLSPHFILLMLLLIFTFCSSAFARDPHPRKVRIKNESQNIIWATRIPIYSSLWGTRLKNVVADDRYCKEGVWKCDCFFLPLGPMSEWVKITRNVPNDVVQRYGNQCYAPPYSTSGPWWDWLVSGLKNEKRGKESTLDQIPAIGILLGMDGEGRPLKSGDGWRTLSGDDMLSQFQKKYTPAVINEVQKLYPGKTIRAHTGPDSKDFFLEAGIDFHRESLGADERQAYLYEGQQWTGMGWWQGYADYYWVTNTLGLSPDRGGDYGMTLSALSKHTDSMTGGLGLTDDFSKWAVSYMGRDIRDTPGTWIYLRDTIYRKKEWYPDDGATPLCHQKDHLFEVFANNFSGKYGDYDFYLYRSEELEWNHTVPVKGKDLPRGIEEQIYSYHVTRTGWKGMPDDNCTPDRRGMNVTISKYVGRKVADGSRYMSFDIDDGYVTRFAGQSGVSWDFRLVFLDQGTDTFKLQYKNKDGLWQEKPITKTNTSIWKEISFSISDAIFNNTASEGFGNAADYPTDFRLDFGNPTVATVINFIEVKARGGMAKEEVRPKAQVNVDLIRKKEDDPKKGIYSVGLNQLFWVKATLTDNQGNPISNERIMFTYNTEWNLAKSAITNAKGEAYANFSTANNPNSSGFLAGGGVGGYKASSYSVQAYFPGSEGYQPSRNDAKLWVTDSRNPTDPRNLRMEIKNVSPIQSDGKVNVTYQLYNPAGPVGGPVPASIGRREGFYADDLSVQTISIFDLANGHFATSGHVTLKGNTDSNPAKVEGVEVSNGPASDKVIVIWKKNPESDIAGYRIHYGTESGNYSKVFGAGNANSATIANLTPGKNYYLSVRAYNVKAYEGEYSAEVSITLGNTSNPNKLRVIKVGLGSGTVTGNEINCGSDCEVNFVPGASVTLTATADGDSVFTGWSGGTCTGTGPCTLAMNACKTVTGLFSKGLNPAGTSYKITASGNNGGTLSPSGEVTVNQGASRTFTINANNGYAIADVKVDGVSKGASSTYTFSNVTSNHTIAAVFNVLSSNQYSLTIQKAGTGNGIVTANPSGTGFNAGTVVTLTAAPDGNSTFKGWSGACPGTSLACTVTLNGNLTGIATFDIKNPSVDPKRVIFDMNGDRKAEILWQHQTRGEVYVWYMDGANLIRDEHIATLGDDLNWKIVGVGDFSGDGKPDILWHHQQRGEVYVWFMDGTKFLYDQHIRTVGDDLGWKIVGVSDFNGDGKPDILWHHQQRGEVYVWFMDGATFVRDQHIRTINDDLLWKIAGVGDFNGDGKPDILWHHQQRGDVYVWYMDGAKFLYDKYIRTVPEIEWQIEALGDYNGDGKADILWRNQRTGEVYVWFMDGTTFVRDQFLRIVEDTAWRIVN